MTDSRVTPIQLKGEKVLLREKRLSDALSDYRWSTDPELSKLDAATPMRLSFQQAMGLYEEELAYPSGRRQRFAVDTHSGEHIGNCMIYDINESRGEAELGIMIGDRRYWGNRYGTDAVNTLLRYTFRHTRLTRIYLHTLDWNERAQRSFMKSGFTSLGPVRRNAMHFKAMEVLKADWEKAQTALDEPATGQTV